MCSNIVEIGKIEGSGQGQSGWFTLKQAVVSFDHPAHTNADHAINIDFVNYDKGLGARVPVELTAASARELIRLLEEALNRGEASHLSTDTTTDPAH